MYRSSPARKYGPLALLAAVQLVVVLVAPSTAPSSTTADLAAGGFPLAGAPGVVDPATGVSVDPATGVAVDPATGVTVDPAAPAPGAAPGGDTAGTAVDPAAPAGPAAPGAPDTTGAPAPDAAAAPGEPAPVAGSTAHCKGGRQFDPAVEFFAPPCVPGTPGAKGVANGGATAPGVTADKITVVHYIPDYGAEVNAILRAQGLFYDAGNARTANAAFQTFINKSYQLYGRSVDIKTYQGTCRTVPPDLQCLIPEMTKIAKEFKPYAVFFSTTVCSACFAELARNKVVSFGGSGFSEEFRNALKPYNYDERMSSTRMARVFAEFWCKQMAGKPAIYAGDQNPAQDFRTVKRRLGVVSTNDPDNERVIRQVLYPALKSGCGESVGSHEYFYEQNVGTAATQSQAGTAVMNSPRDPATSVVCFCDPVAPQFSYNAATNNNYWPEALYASNQSMDVDSTGQTYMDGLACPQRNRGCAFDGAVGLGQSDKARPPAQLGGIKVFKASSRAAVPLAPLVMEIFWQNYNMFASLVQATGPQLTPARMAAAAPTLGSRGGGTTGYPRRAFEDGELSWTRDVYISYWSKNRVSPFNGERGAYVQVDGGRRYGLGQIPRAAQPSAPVKEQRR